MSNTIYFVCGDRQQLPHVPTGRLGFHFDAKAPGLVAPDWVDGGDFMVLQDSLLPTYPMCDQLVSMVFHLCRQEFPGLICDFEQSVHPFFGEFIQRLSPRFQQHHIPLWLPITYHAYSDYGVLMIQTSFAQGGFVEQLKQHSPPHRLALELCCAPSDCQLGTTSPERITLGQLASLQQAHRPAIHTSSALQCKYFSYLQAEHPHTVFFHDKTTLESRIQTANAMGIDKFIGLYQELVPLGFSTERTK